MTAAVDRTPSEADVCVVGAGPAGAFVAHSLASRGHDVVVLEAGERLNAEDHHRRMEMWLRPVFERNEFWFDRARDAYTSTGDIYARLNLVRVKAVGGTSLHWDGNTPRLHEKDFEMNTRYGLARDWPISYDDLRPYYARAEREMGVSGIDDNPHGPPRAESYPMEGFPPSYSDSLFADACDELGISMATQPKAINSESYDDRSGCIGYGVCNACPSGAKYSADVHVRKAESEGARVIDQVQVLSVEHDRDGEAVESVVYVTPDGTEYRQEADHFVIACGGIETPRLLLLSDSSEYPDGLANSSGAVGRYLMDHPNVSTEAQLDEPTRQNNIGWVSSRSDQFYDHDEPSPGSFHLTFSNTAKQTWGGAQAKQTATANLLKTLGSMTPSAFIEWLGDPLDETKLGDDLAFPTTDGPPYPLSVRGAGEMLPRAGNRVTLDRSKTDSFGRPVPSIQLSDGAHAQQTMEHCLEVQESIMQTLGADITGVSTLADRDMGSHHMGTTRMGTDPAESVVNEECRTHDLENLWISSSSVFTTGGANNPTLTIAALALKTADHIDDRL
ncbi:GMC family oxidoreductase [Salinigranum rubrum]|uniref:GMC family oxidoreductase n=1 Tax=Salinigranum rubrum TaxID=755307 RepID=A0A2I8VHP4_9EURY|nr:GMC family oxidoreductase [Salinigranum rubrum]AUV81430.1 GMC family oxidoreductase [Salinigranum rubrum]